MHPIFINATTMQVMIAEDVGVPELKYYPEYAEAWQRKHPLKTLRMAVHALFSKMSPKERAAK